MLIRFIVSNFLSFKEETEFNMLAGVDQKHHKDHIYKRNSVDLLKTAALYGANGAGKSNLIKAVNLLKSIIIAGGKETLLGIKKYKLEQSYQKLPSKFEIEFIKNNIVYLFGVEVRNNEISEEWLYKSGLNKIKDKLLFHRKGKGENIEIKFSKDYSRTEKDKFNLEFVQNNLVKKEELLLKILFELKAGFEEIKTVYEWFRNNLIIIFPRSKPTSIIVPLLMSNPFRKFAESSLCSFQTGISSIEIQTLPFEDFIMNNTLNSTENIIEEIKEGEMMSFKTKKRSEEVIVMLKDGEIVIKRFISKHRNKNGESLDFYLEEESDGTNRLLDLIPALFDFLTSEAVILIDEIDQSIHPVLLKDLVSKFVSDEKSKGQFIFTTHEANLLDQSIFRRDEIWFVEKDKGETKLYPLSDFDIRYDLDIRKGYLNGRFGAIPFMGDLQNLNWDQYAEAE